MNDFDIGDSVKIYSPGHLQDGKIGTVVYHGEFLKTIGVEFDGQRYGFWTDELIKEETHEV
jgi:hypothetical protein